MVKRKKFSSFKRQLVFNKTSGKCGYCGNNLTPETFQIDHIYPISKGGSNQMHNLMASCPVCNKSKATLTTYEFKQKLMGIVDNIRKSNAKFRLVEHYGIVWCSDQYITFYYERLKQ